MLCWLCGSECKRGAFLGFRLQISPRTASPFWQTPQKEPKGLRPCIRVWLRQTSLTPSLLQGPAAKGHPWPIAVRRVDGRSHPPFRFRVSQWWKSLRRFPPYRAAFPRAAQRKTTRQLGAQVPVRRPSGGVAQGGARGRTPSEERWGRDAPS
jgi:hypothetical protein